MASRKLEHLHRLLLPLAERFLEDCKMCGLDILVTCTYRSNEEQNNLYEIGRSKPGRIVTYAKGGQSEHNYTENGIPQAKAFDIVPMVSGKCDWNVKSPQWAKVAEIWSNGYHGHGHYLDWYGRESAKFREYPHFCLKEDI